MATFTALLFVGLISYIVYLDAEALSRLHPEPYRREMRAEPATWAVFSFLLLIVAGPAYLVFRYRFFRKAAAVPDPFPPRADGDTSHQIVRATGIVIVWFILHQVYTIAAFPTLLSFSPSHFNLPRELHLTLAGAILFFGTVLLLRDRKVNLLRSLYLKADHPGKRRQLVLAAVGGVLLASLSYLIQRTRTAPAPTPIGAGLQSSTPTALMQFMFMAALLAPLFEEVLYRGFVFDVLAKTKGRTVAFAVVTAAFALAHFPQLSGDWMMMAIIVLVACGLTYIRMSANTVVPGMLAHYSYNIGLFLIPVAVLATTNPSYAKYAWLRGRLPVDAQIVLLKKSIAEQPKQWDAYNQLAWALVNEKRELPEALRLIDLGLTGSPNNLSFLDTKAEILFNLNRVEEALVIGRAVAEKAPDKKRYRDQLAKFQAAAAAGQTRSGTEKVEAVRPQP
jgi:membrane protease YdiL (CAAX protease family)